MFYLRAPLKASNTPTQAKVADLSIKRERVETLLNRARVSRVAVVGDCMLDVYLTGDATRISSEAPVPVVRVEGERVAPGGAGNVAAAVAALGVRCELVGVVGDDAAADQLRAALDEFGVGSSRLIVDSRRGTTTKTRVMARHQQILRFDRETDEDVQDELADRIVGQLEEISGSVKAIVLQDYNKGVMVPRVIRKAIDLARRQGIPSVADPKSGRFFEYSGVHLFKPSAHELAEALGESSAPRDLEGLRDARERLGCAHLLVTLADEGMILFGPQDTLKHIPSATRDVFDVSGARDTVAAVLAVVMAAGGTELEAAVFANYAAGLEVDRHGIVPVRAEEILAALSLGS